MTKEENWRDRFDKQDLGCCGGEYCSTNHTEKITAFIDNSLREQREKILVEIMHLENHRHDCDFGDHIDKDEAINIIKDI